MAATEDVYCTLVMNDAYLPGAAVLAHSLRDSGTKHKLAVLVTTEAVSQTTLSELHTFFDHVLPAPRLVTPNLSNLYLMSRPDLLHTFTKIHLWRQTHFRRIIYIDADVVALRAPDELFALPDTFAAAPDIGWPDCFNSGVMALTPHMGDYWALQTLANAGDSFDGADQGLLNQYFEHKPWKRLSFAYNCTPSANYQYEPAYRYFKHKISLVHFLGRDKPWRLGRRAPVANGAYQELLARWWAVWDRHFGGDVAEYAATGRGGPMSTSERSRNRATAEHTIPSPPESTVNTTEAPFTEPSDALEALAQGHTEPLPTAQVRRFSAPHMEWDATRSAPPLTSKPEAANFPSAHYTFTTDATPFIAPSAYPAPPPVHFPIPPSTSTSTTTKPPPIFPWEDRPQAKPSRTFAPDPPSHSSSASNSPPFTSTTADELEVSPGNGSASATPADPPTPTTPAIKVSPTPWEAFTAGSRNAWDEVQGIDSYVRALSAWQKSRAQGGPGVVGGGVSGNGSAGGDGRERTGEGEGDVVALVERASGRRESLILTDFPTEVERPSLPVTPAPRRRSFWGVDGSGSGGEGGEGKEGAGSGEADEGLVEGEGGAVFMRQARGVVSQADWDPNAQLEQLRRSSLVNLGELKLPDRAGRVIPSRAMPASSAEGSGVALEGEAGGIAAATSKAEVEGHVDVDVDSYAGGGGVRFAQPGFGSKGAGAADGHGLLSPGEV